MQKNFNSNKNNTNNFLSYFFLNNNKFHNCELWKYNFFFFSFIKLSLCLPRQAVDCGRILVRTEEKTFHFDLFWYKQFSLFFFFLFLLYALFHFNCITINVHITFMCMLLRHEKGHKNMLNKWNNKSLKVNYFKLLWMKKKEMWKFLLRFCFFNSLAALLFFLFYFLLLYSYSISFFSFLNDCGFSLLCVSFF